MHNMKLSYSLCVLGVFLGSFRCGLLRIQISLLDLFYQLQGFLQSFTGVSNVGGQVEVRYISYQVWRGEEGEVRVVQSITF